MQLIEVLVSLMILSLTLLGFDAMQVFALRENRQAYFSTVAQNQIYSMTEYLKLNSNSEHLQKYIQKWQQQNQEVLPQAKGEVSQDSSSYKIRLCWNTNNPTPNCLSMQSPI